MTEPRGVMLEDLTWPEAKARFDDGAVVVVPVGAQAKEHGHHLPLNTDFLMARELGKRVAHALSVVVAPVIGFGYYPAFCRYPGSQHLRAETFIALLTDILEGFIAQGVVHLAIINTGVSTESPLRIAVRDILAKHGVRVAIADIRGLGAAVENLLEQKLGGHGDEHETSVIMAIKPEAVHAERARTDYGNMLEQADTVFYQPSIFCDDPASGIDFSATGVRGDPTLATREKGVAALDAMTSDLVDGLRKLYPDI